jgi:uncharacterized membrane protein
MTQHAWAVGRLVLKCFLAGVFAVLPLVITVAAVAWVVQWLGGVLGPNAFLGQRLQQLGVRFTPDSIAAYFVGWIIVLAVIFILGVLLEMGAKRFLQDRLDKLLTGLPLLGGVYGTVRQLVGMMDKAESADLKGMRVVFCIFGGDTGAAFLALLPTPEVFRVGEIDYNAVIIPSAPVPVGGSLIFVPATSIRPADVSVDAFMSIYVSMGVTGPQFLTLSKPS